METLSQEPNSIFDHLQTQNFTFMPSLKDYDKNKVLESLQLQFSALKCCRKNCWKFGKLFHPHLNEVLCHDHYNELASGDSDDYSYLKVFWMEITNSVNDIEKSFFKSQLIFAFYENKFKDKLNAKNKKIIECKYASIKRIIDSFNKKVGSLDSSTGHLKFKFVKDSLRSMRETKSEFFETFGSIWADSIADYFLDIILEEDDGEQDLSYTSSVGITQSIYDKEYEITYMPGTTKKRVSAYENDVKEYYTNRIDNTTMIEKMKFSEIMQKESERWSDYQDTMFWRHQDYLFSLMDNHSWTVGSKIQEYLKKYNCNRRTWWPELANDNIAEMTEWLKENHLMFDSKLDDEYCLDLDLDINYYEVHNFLDKAKYSKMPRYHKFNIVPIWKLSPKGLADLNMFLNWSTPDYLGVLSACWGDFMYYDQLSEAFSLTLKYVRKQLYLAKFILDADSLRSIFVKACKVNEICFASWKFLFVNYEESQSLTSDMMPELHLNVKLNYEIRHLKFFGEYSGDNNELAYKVDNLTLNSLFCELSTTNMTETLQTVCVDPSWFDPIKFQKILKDYGFKAKVITEFEQKPAK